MQVRSELVVCSTVNPKTGSNLFVEVTPLFLVPTTFYDPCVRSDEVAAVEGWLTIIGGKLYRVAQIPPEEIDQENDTAFFRCCVDWNDLVVKPQEIPREVE